jgi:hypothetical protein
MARTRRSLRELIDEVFRMLRETDDEFFDRQDLIDLWNQAKDEREMELHGAHEGFGLARISTDLVAGQADYEIPEDMGRLKRVLRVVQGQEIPLGRDELWSGPVAQESTGSGPTYLPSYRLVGSMIRLSPAPSADEADPALIIEFEASTERMTEDTHKLPMDWPIFSETLLVLDTWEAAYQIERTMGEAPTEKYDVNPIRKRRDTFAAKWADYCETRSFGRSFAERFSLGA